uniref:Iodothyronine deiodinase n=1 Tax=Arcella intermedia TaxID=1963864 RepID=A0A6B2LUR9_9EUKA
MVYIAEAHASDIWPLGKQVCITNHKSIEERRSAAKRMVEEFGFEIPILLDTMSDEFDKQYAVWPERYYCVKDGKMHMIGKPTHEFGYDRGTLYRLIDSFVPKNPL